jgi:hypothetical protein
MRTKTVLIVVAAACVMAAIAWSMLNDGSGIDYRTAIVEHGESTSPSRPPGTRTP